MLGIKYIRENTALVQKNIENKGIHLDLNRLLELDKQTVQISKDLQLLQEQKNQVAKEIPKLAPELREEFIKKGKLLNEQITEQKKNLTTVEMEFEGLMLLVPNVAADDVPVGKSAEENVVISKWGERPHFDFKPLDHVEILKAQGWADFDRIAKVCGSRSYSLMDEGLILEMALIRFGVDRLRKNGFRLIEVPAYAFDKAFVGTGHFPTGKDQVFRFENDPRLMIGTSEVVINSLHSDEILSESDLPLLYGGVSSCFRSEAGSAGKDVRGLVRVHQFQKVEQFVLCKADVEESERWHKKLLQISESILQDLALPYQVIACCTGDMGAGKFRMHDIESWVPSQSKYMETHSCSSLQSWQARRTNLRYRNAEGKVEFCFTLNNTAVAVPRLLVPLMEIHQQSDGTIQIPKALQPYLDGKDRLGKSCDLGK